MDQNTPPSPAPTKAEPLPTGFNELLQHNSVTSYPRDALPSEIIQAAHSQPASRYGTPAPQPQPHHPQGYDASMYQHRGGGGELPGYHQHAIYQQDNSPYGPIPEPLQPYSTPATSPPTPSRGSDMVPTRGSSIARGDIASKVLAPRSTRIEKSTPKKKKERAKPAKNMPMLDKPMSELTKNSSIPIADIETYVNRSSEIRRQEVETGKNPGRVKRPMNAFMLYRKAYQQRAKEWASQHNHQIVSRVCGMSWPLEPEHIRQQFKMWADIERDNHQKAHPNYKFTPSKPQKAAKFEGPYDDNSDGSDLEDYDWTGRAGSRIRSSTNTPNDDGDYIPNHSSVYAATHAHAQQLANMHGMGMLHQGRSALDFHMAKPMATGYDHRELQGHYYDAHIRNPQQRHLQHGMGEDLLLRKTPSPSLTYQQTHDGLRSPYELSSVYQIPAQRGEQPAQSQHQQRQQQSHQPHHGGQHFEHRIDPSLMPGEESLFDAGSFSSLPSIFDGGLGGTQQSWQTATTHLSPNNDGDSQFSHAFLGLDETLSLEQHAQFLRGADEWQIEPLPETAQFDTSWVEPKAET